MYGRQWLRIMDGYVDAPPGQVDLLIDFLNTLDTEAGTDTLARADAFATWCRDHGQRPGDRHAARDLRDTLRALLLGQHTRLSAVAIPVALAPGGGTALAPIDLAQSVLATVTVITWSGNWNRVKLCPANDCLEAFYDRSRNRSRVWCDMADCGNLAKVRGYRARS
jgi:hypothetical protein